MKPLDFNHLNSLHIKMIRKWCELSSNDQVTTCPFYAEKVSVPHPIMFNRNVYRVHCSRLCGRIFQSFLPIKFMQAVNLVDYCPCSILGWVFVINRVTYTLYMMDQEHLNTQK